MSGIMGDGVVADISTYTLTTDSKPKKASSCNRCGLYIPAPISTETGPSFALATYGCCNPDSPCNYCLTTRATGWRDATEKAREANKILAGQLRKAETEIDRLREALTQVATFGHNHECKNKSAPIYECGCYEYSQWYLAQRALDGNIV